MTGRSVFIIIPNFNGLKHLKDCFDSLQRQSFKDFGVILVDNNSADDSVAFTRNNYPDVRILKMSTNTGFAKAVNEGIKEALGQEGCKYIILLNNDTECDADFLREMLRAVNMKDAGSGACKMLNFRDRSMIDDAGDFIKPLGSPYARGFGEKDEGQYDKAEYIFGACAGAAIYKREVFEEAGFFDEDFFAYYEDVDFSFRLQLLGYRCYYNPKAVCYHKRGATTSGMSGFQTMLCEKNLIALRIKNYPGRLYLYSFPFFAAVRVKRYLIFLFRHSPSLFASAVKGYIQGLGEIGNSLRKRKDIIKKKRVSEDYVRSILK